MIGSLKNEADRHADKMWLVRSHGPRGRKAPAISHYNIPSHRCMMCDWMWSWATRRCPSRAARRGRDAGHPGSVRLGKAAIDLKRVVCRYVRPRVGFRGRARSTPPATRRARLSSSRYERGRSPRLRGAGHLSRDSTALPCCWAILRAIMLDAASMLNRVRLLVSSAKSVSAIRLLLAEMFSSAI